MQFTPDSFLYAGLSLSFALNIVFARRLLAKVDKQGETLFNPKDGLLVRVDRLERTMERRASVTRTLFFPPAQAD